MNMAQQFPGGLYIGFVGMVDRKAAEQLAFLANDGLKQGFNTVHLVMSSRGGDVDHGFYAATILDALPITFITYNIGDVHSAANLIFLIGQERYAIDGAPFLFHLPSAGAPPEGITSAVLRYRVKAFDIGEKRIANYVAQKTGKPLAEVEKWHRDETLMNTAEALTNNVIHGVKAPAIPRDAFFTQIVF